MAGGGYHSSALKSDGTVVAWGANDAGQTDVPAGTERRASGRWRVPSQSRPQRRWYRSRLGVEHLGSGGRARRAEPSDRRRRWRMAQSGPQGGRHRGDVGETRSGQTDLPAGLSGVRAVAAGFLHNLALKDGASFPGDTTPPAAPTVTLTDPVNAANQATVAVSGSGEVTTRARIFVDDEDPTTPPVTTFVGVSEAGYSATLDLSSFTSGMLTATVTLRDPAGNTGPAGTATARKVGPPAGGHSGQSAQERAKQAFSRVLRPVDESNRSTFATYLAMAQAGASYEELVTRVTRDYVTEAYDKIFRYRNDPAFSPTAKTAVPFNEDVYDTVLTWVKAPGPLYIDGVVVPNGAEAIWTYVAKSAPVWGAHSGGDGKTNGEKCFGAMGPGCKGTGPLGKGAAPHGVEQFRRMDGLEMHYIDISVGVGGIAHDRACLQDLDSDYYVAYCNGGPGDPRSAAMEKECLERNAHCQGVREWWKASANLFDGRRLEVPLRALSLRWLRESTQERLSDWRCARFSRRFVSGRRIQRSSAPEPADRASDLTSYRHFREVA